MPLFRYLLPGHFRRLEGVGVSSISNLSRPYAIRQNRSARITYAHGLPCAWEGDRPAAPRRSYDVQIHGAAKRLLDVIVSCGVLVFLLPLFLFIAVAIKVSDPGPVLFVQPREGRNGRAFRIFKFRTMRHAARCVDGVEQTTAGDCRVSTVGSFLRRHSIDELPQFFNVLIGDMSLVGPRPHVEGQLAGGRPYREVVPFYDMRLSVKPGITGWAQVNGLRGPTNDADKARARIEHDVAYIQNLSLGLDLRILTTTALREFINGSGS